MKINPRSDSYEALMWDVITNAHRYIPKDGDRVLDLGAHFGMFSLYCASRGCSVIAVEPTDESYAELEHSAQVAKEIGLGRIHPVKTAVWSTSGPAILFCDPNTSGANSLLGGSSDHVQAIDALTLDCLLGYNHWDCMKMDIEGAEHAVLMTSEHLNQVKFLSVEIHNDRLSADQCGEIYNRLCLFYTNIETLPVKKNPDQAVAYFCSR